MELIERGAVGEIAGWAYDGAGRLIECSVNERNAALPLANWCNARMIGVSGGSDRSHRRSPRHFAAGLLGGLITDERTAEALLRRRVGS